MDELSVYRGRRVLVTGHTGFKGAWLCSWLNRLGADVVGYALAPPTTPSLFDEVDLRAEMTHHVGDIRDRVRLDEVVHAAEPEMVFHLAAQPLVRRSYRDPRETFEVNVNGTMNVLESARSSESVRAVVCVTTDKCYENRGWIWGYRENDPLGGDDPYSASKACTEVLAHSYRTSFFVPAGVGLATARAGNVIGGGDWAEDRLVPDCVRAFGEGKSIELRNPNAVRPWQHVLDALAGYLALGARLWHAPTEYSEAWNFGPGPENACSVGEIVDRIIRQGGTGSRHSTTGDNPPEAHTLRLGIDKAVAQLPWRPMWNLDQTLEATLTWYRAFGSRPDADELRKLTHQQIAEYEFAWSQALGERTNPLTRKRATA